ncbi:hypothetical protein ROTO_27770 [Roseovarius tolerans]|uniref:Uncharacterized protein n=1 Tax=Roseovarius tolerans TaxID=74031 RepID=A0A0L6CSF6_9RHOB|nr:hypothetical protein ROTO_27770 [Roseovarius tolerans]
MVPLTHTLCGLSIEDLLQEFKINDLLKFASLVPHFRHKFRQ